MENRGLSRADSIPYLGSKKQVSEVLNRKRGLSLVMIRRLREGLGIPADLLIRPQRATCIHPARIKSHVQVCKELSRWDLKFRLAVQALS